MKRVAVVVSVLLMALVTAIAVRVALPDDLPPVVVVHWSNSHPMREDLLPKMAEEFNAGGHTTPSGHPIEVVLVLCDSFAQVEDLVSRVVSGGPARQRCEDDAGAPAPEPTVVTPQSDDWLVYANHQAGRTVVDLAATDDIAETWLGIVTYRDIADVPWLAGCSGWLRGAPHRSRAWLGRPRVRQCRVGLSAEDRVHQPGHVHDREERTRLVVCKRGGQEAR